MQHENFADILQRHLDHFIDPGCRPDTAFILQIERVVLANLNTVRFTFIDKGGLKLTRQTKMLLIGDEFTEETGNAVFDLDDRGALQIVC